MSHPSPGLPSAPAVRTWRAGMLTYTAAGIVTLFTFMLLGDFAWALRERGIKAIFK